MNERTFTIMAVGEDENEKKRRDGREILHSGLERMTRVWTGGVWAMGRFRSVCDTLCRRVVKVVRLGECFTE
jgi:hypothetical protein